MGLIFPRRFTSQPPPFTRRNPSQEGLTALVLPGGSAAVDVVSGNRATPVGSATTIAGLGGVVAEHQYSPAKYWTLPSSPGNNLAGAFSIVWYGRVTDNGARTFVAKGNSISSATPYVCGTSGGNNLIINRGGAGDYQVFTGSVATVPSSGMAFIVWTQDGVTGTGKNARGFCNGVFDTLTGGGMADATATQNASNVTLGATLSGGGTLGGGPLVVAFYNRVLSDSEIVALYRSPWQLFQEQRGILVPSATGGASLPVGLATETDTALPLASARPAGLAAEANAALALVGAQVRSVGLAAETDAALALSVARPAGLSTETDAALAAAGVQLRTTGLSTETDAAISLAAVQIRAVGLASETDTALALSAGASSAVGLAAETNTALPLGAARPTGLAAETDAALAASGVQLRAAGLATETDAALALPAAQARATGLASETDTAFALSLGATGSAGLAAETDTAFALAARQIQATGLATETDAALALGIVVARPVGLAIEVDAAFALAAVGQRMVGRADETDTAVALFTPGAIPAGLASETDVALALLGQQNGRGWRADRSLQGSARSQQASSRVRRN